MKTAQQIVDDFNNGVTTDSVTKRDLVDHVSSLLEENGRLRRRDFVVSMTSETLARYVNERDETILELKEIGRDWKHKAEIRLRAFERLERVLKTLPDKVLQLDAWADIEELTFPLLDPTEDEQNEWFEEFCKRQEDYVRGCFEEALTVEETDEQS